MWEEQAGTGTVYSWVTVHHPVLACQADEVPYVVALVEIEAGVKIPARLAASPAVVYAGMPVRAVFRALDGDVVVADFVPAELERVRNAGQV